MYFHYPYLIDEETVAQSGHVTCGQGHWCRRAQDLGEYWSGRAQDLSSQPLLSPASLPGRPRVVGVLGAWGGVEEEEEGEG